jgi:hypothetical protein
MIVVLVISIDFLMPKAAAPQPEFVTKIMYSPPTLPEYREGTRQRAQRRECTPMTTQTSVLLRKSCRALAARRSSWIPSWPR